MSIGASHYYGRIVYPDKRYKKRCKEREVDVKYTLTEGDAKELNRFDDYCTYEADEESSRFLNEDLLLRKAIELYKKEFPNAKALIKGSTGVCSVQPVIDGTKEFMKWGNALNDEWERINGYDGEHEDRAEEIDKEWCERTRICK